MRSLSYTATIANGDVPDATPLNTKFNDVATLINSTKLDPDNLNNGAPGSLIVCNASGVPQYTPVSGDFTFSSGGLATLAAENHYATPSADRSLLINAYQTIPGLNAMPTTTGRFLIMASIDFQVAGQTTGLGPVYCVAQAFQGSTIAAGKARFTHYFTQSSTSEVAGATASYIGVISATAGTLIQFQAQLEIGSTLNFSSATVTQTYTAAEFIRIYPYP